MIDVRILLSSFRPVGDMGKAVDSVADAIKRGSKEERREFVYSYLRIKEQYESYLNAQENGEEIDETEADDCTKRYLIYRLAFQKLGIDIDKIS